MGCLFCNITACEEFIQGDGPPVKNPFYCKTPEDRAEFVNELCYDIAGRHHNVARRIFYYTVLVLYLDLKRILFNAFSPLKQ